MKRYDQLIWLLPLIFLLGCSDGLYSATIIFEGEHRFAAGTELPGDLFVRAGEGVLAADAVVSGSVTILGGKLAVEGVINGDVTLLGGTLQLGPTAVVGGDLRLGGGTVERAETAVITGDITASSAELPLETLSWQRRGENFLRELSAALLLAIVGALFARSRPQPLARIGTALTDHLPVSAASGLLILLVLPALLVMMAFTIVLIPLVIIIGLGLLLLGGYGFAAAGGQLGVWLGTVVKRPISLPAATFWGTLLLYLLSKIPILGDGLLIVTVLLALGALLLTRLGTRPFVSAAAAIEAEADYGRPTLKEQR